jgi:transmembrane 9 superfamily protein 3
VTEANQFYCKKTLDAKDVDVLRYAVDNQYWYTMFIGNNESILLGII